jgi:hypothetical protein
MTAGYARRVLLPIPEPFGHPEFIFDPKIDGFRAVAFCKWNRLPAGLT